jgi:hypothetical protein
MHVGRSLLQQCKKYFILGKKKKNLELMTSMLCGRLIVKMFLQLQLNKSPNRSISPRQQGSPTSVSGVSSHSSPIPTPRTTAASPITTQPQIKDDGTDSNHNALHPCIQQGPVEPSLITAHEIGQYFTLITINSTN